MNTESRVSTNKAEIDRIETELKANGYRQVLRGTKLQPYQYFRNEWTGTASSFEGLRNYQIKWCKPSQNDG